jgi:RNA polymerase sigma factor (sigma-70 family)
MSDESTPGFQSLIQRLQRGDPDARNDLIALAYDRLRGLARKILHQDFPSLRRAHDATSVAHQAADRLLKALEQVQPANVAEFLGFAALQVRRVLLDLSRKSGRPEAGAGSVPEAVDDTLDPVRLAIWTELQEQMEKLPEERKVIELCWHLGLTQAEAATLLEIHPKEVSRRWIRAIRKLPPFIP